jgi:hypothetical protein
VQPPRLGDLLQRALEFRLCLRKFLTQGTGCFSLLFIGGQRVTDLQTELADGLLLFGLPLAQRLALGQDGRDLGVLVVAELNLAWRSEVGRRALKG